MTRLVAYKYRLYPNKTQETKINKTFGRRSSCDLTDAEVEDTKPMKCLKFQCL
jgi:hypothetical protein